ncbi:MAG: DsrE family protein [Parvularculaceae bacterium]
MRAAVFALLCLTTPAAAQQGPNPNFHPGTYIAEFGPIASVDSDQAIPNKARFKIRYDVKDAAAPGEQSKSLVAVARFLNMSVENGVDPKNIKLAVVVHGGATKDLTTRDDNSNAALIAALTEKGVDIYLCGQSAAAYNVKKEDLLSGVKMSLSAMHAHAILDADGYSLNPF